VNNELSTTKYRCPGETYSISRAVHLARLADYYAACRNCPRREETVGLSKRQARRVTEAHSRPGESSSQVGGEGIRNTAINDMSPLVARAIAVEFARRRLDDCRKAQPAIVFASDGRLSTAAIVAAVVEGIRWTGCEAVDLGTASAPCMARAIERLDADGGIYLGNPSGAAHTVGMKFWVGGEPLSQGEYLEGLNVSGTPRVPLAGGTRSVPDTLDRPTRAFGPLRRVDAAEGYLNELRPAYHALRPLRFVLRCSCEPIVAYLADLLQNVACRVIPSEPGGNLGTELAAAKAHFGIEITDDGEKVRVFDERGHAVAAERLESLIEAETDALRTLTYLLVLLSRDDLAFSAVLDRACGER
jgi:phosphomannomutase